MISASPELLRRLQQVILMVAKDFDDFCRREGITYYLMGGTALGAMRHGGFIPWDDDFDVFMDRPNYLKFLTAADRLDTSKYYLQREDTEEWPLFFSKLRLNGTKLVEHDNRGRVMHEGIYIDIMCLNGAASITPWRYVQYLAGKALSAYGLARRGYDTSSRPKRLAMAAARVMVGLPPVKAGLLAVVRGLNDRPRAWVGHFFGRAPFAAASFPTRYLGQPRRVAFEDALLPVPEEVEAYLTARFGPYHMAMPSTAERAKWGVHALAVDFGRWAP